MKNKKMAALVVSVALIGIIGVGATLAYFTDQTDVRTNVVTLGMVDIDLTETTDEEYAEITDEGIEFTHVMPGDTISKVPVVTAAEDSEDAYVRVKLDISGEIFEPLERDISDNPADMLDIGEKWVLSEDGYYYYQDILHAGETTDPLFTEVSIPNWNNRAAETSFYIDMQADAIQAANYTVRTNTAGQIDGWYDENNMPVVIERYK